MRFVTLKLKNRQNDLSFLLQQSDYNYQFAAMTNNVPVGTTSPLWPIFNVQVKICFSCRDCGIKVMICKAVDVCLINF